jgi:ketosteroid isomerase-like protein
MDVTTEHLIAWLAGYVDAWTSSVRADVETLFTDDATYYPEPYAEPIVGASAIADAWLEDPDEPWRWAAEYRPLVVSGDVGVAAGTSTYYADDGSVENVFHNVFVLTFADDGRCSEYREWFMAQPFSEEADA